MIKKIIVGRYIYGAEEYYWKKFDSDKELDVTTKIINNHKQIKTYNLKNNFGTLEEGEYRLRISVSSFMIIVNFSVDADNVITYDDPYLIKS